MSEEQLTRTEIEELLEKYGYDNEFPIRVILETGRHYGSFEEESTTFRIASDYTKTGSNAIKEYIWGVLCDNWVFSQIVSQLEPIHDRKWSRLFYTQTKNPMVSEVHENDCFYVESEFTGNYGKQYWVSINNLNNDLTALPCRKGFNKLEVGKCYRVKHFNVREGRGYKYYQYEFEEITEEDFLMSFARNWGLPY